MKRLVGSAISAALVLMVGWGIRCYQQEHLNGRLMQAVYAGNHTAVRRFLADGANPNAAWSGHTAWEVLIDGYQDRGEEPAGERFEMTWKLLVDAGFDDDWTLD